ncbi:hypothetical protein Scep_030936 [Stephania cephalantha]|uniref:Uncharacterized protein n=1 Tax=Stephania cephalantha TaxID=152367 RepID=A0AAP0HJ23_9MAGN
MSTWTDVDMYSVHVDKEGFSRSTWIHVDRKTVTKGADSAFSKALSAPHLSSSANRRRESRVGGEGGSDPWRETRGGRKKEATVLRFLPAAVHTRAAETKERRCGGVTGARSGGSQQQQQRQWYVEAFAWRWYVEEETAKQQCGGGSRARMRRRSGASDDHIHERIR